MIPLIAQSGRLRRAYILRESGWTPPMHPALRWLGYVVTLSFAGAFFAALLACLLF